MKSDRVYWIFGIFVLFSVAAGCAKKPLPLSPPPVISSRAPSVIEREEPRAARIEEGDADAASAQPPPAGAEPEEAQDLTPPQEESSDQAAAIQEEEVAEAGESSALGGAPAEGTEAREGTVGEMPPGSAAEAPAGEPGSLAQAPAGEPGSAEPPAAQPAEPTFETFTERKKGDAGNGSEEVGKSPAFGIADESEEARVAKMLPFQPTTELTDIHFKFDRFDLDEFNKGVLRVNARWLRQHSNVKVEIQGHCDERGTNNYNLALGERRALSAKKYLMALGIEESRLFVISYGEEKPFCVESAEHCWWQNRRGHFLISK